MSHTFSASSESCTLNTFLHSKKKKKIRGRRDLVTQGAFSFSFSVLLRGANVSHAGKQMCACTNLCNCVGGGPLAHVRVRVRLRCTGAQGARCSRVAGRQILFLQIVVRRKGRDYSCELNLFPLGVSKHVWPGSARNGAASHLQG